MRFGADAAARCSRAPVRRWYAWLWAAVTLVTGGMIAIVLGTRNSAGAPGTAMVVTGTSALLPGAGVLALSWRRQRAGHSGEISRALLGVAGVMWGVSQLMLAVNTALFGGWGFGAAAMLSAVAGPVAALGLLLMPRRSRTAWPALRISLDATLLASVVTLALWWGLLHPAAVAVGAPSSSDAVVATLAAFFDVFTAAFALLVWGRENRPGAFALFVGCVLQAVADVMSLPTVIGHEPGPWQSAVILCVAWPVAGIGAVRMRTARLHPDPENVLEDLGESRMAAFTTAAAVAVLTGVLSLLPGSPWSGIGGVLLVGVLVMLVVREALGGRVRARLVRQLGTEALHDVLTGLPNRRALTARIRALDLDRPWVLLTLDLDDFKEVNGLLGHQAGDELLTAVAALLREHGPQGGTVARIGGDEFAVLAPCDADEGQRLARHLVSAIRTSPLVRRDGVTLSASIGVGRVLPEDPDDQDCASRPTPSAGTARGTSQHHLPALLDPRHDRLVALVESAAALRAAKALGRGKIAAYPGAVEHACQRRLVVEWRLREALEQGRLAMYAQPLVDLGTGRTCGFESLARWTDEVLGPVSPSEFVPVAEQTGLVTVLGDFALRSTLEEARARGVLGRDVEVGVNVSPIQLRLPDFAARVADLVEEIGLAPGQLMLEVTEAILVDEDDPAAGTLAELADAGIQLAIDDFGTGYSALGYLRRLPVDVLKIDRSWVVAAVTDGRTRSIVSGVVDLAHQLGATVVMEGIEDVETADMCRDLGADQGQGWLFGRPKPWRVAVGELEQFEQEQQPSTARG